MNLHNIEQRIPGTVTLLVLVIIGASFALSYTALVNLALAAGIPPSLSWLWPLCLDAFMVVSSLVVLRRELDGETVLWAWVVVSGITIMSIVFNVLDAPDNLISKCVYALPPAVVFISFEMLMSLVKTDIRKAHEITIPLPTTNEKQADNVAVKQPDSVIPKGEPISPDPIVSFYQSHPGAKHIEVSEALNIPRSTVSRRINNLIKSGILIEQDGLVRVSA